MTARIIAGLVAIARVTLPLDVAPLAPLAQLPEALRPSSPQGLTIVEVLPITWATDAMNATLAAVTINNVIAAGPQNRAKA